MSAPNAPDKSAAGVENWYSRLAMLPVVTRLTSCANEGSDSGMMKSRFDGLLAGGVALLMLVSVFGLGVRFFPSLLVSGLGFRTFMLLSGLFSLVVLVGALILLMRLSRYVYGMNGAFRESSSDEPEANAHWDEVSRDRFKPLASSIAIDRDR